MNPNDDHIDQILSREEEIVPSSGFAASVMEAVRREAAVPPPIPFPWKRAWPMVALAGAAIMLVPIAIVMIIPQLAAAPAAPASAEGMALWSHLPGWMSNPASAWAAGSLLLALVSVKFSMRLASR